MKITYLKHKTKYICKFQMFWIQKKSNIYIHCLKQNKIIICNAQKVESNHWAYFISYRFEVCTPHQWRSSTLCIFESELFKLHYSLLFNWRRILTAPFPASFSAPTLYKQQHRIWYTMLSHRKQCWTNFIAIFNITVNNSLDLNLENCCMHLYKN